MSTETLILTPIEQGMSPRRRAFDFYETIEWMTDALVDHLPELSGSIWCPCVGNGQLLERLKARRPDLGPCVANDINPQRAADYHGDATKADVWADMVRAEGRPDWVVENPPFDAEIDIAMQAYEVARKGVVFLARLSFVEGTSATQHQGKACTPRGPWLASHPRIKQIAVERGSFTGNGKSDSATVEWLVWVKPGVSIANPGGHTAFGYKPKGKKKSITRGLPLEMDEVSA